MATLNYLTTTLFDFGAIQRLPDVLARNSISRPLLATDKGLLEIGVVDTILGALGSIPTAVFSDTPENPTEAAVLAAFDLYKGEKCDGVLCVGGGSSMDLGKIVALLATHEGKLSDLAQSRSIGELAPVIAVPTTAGTGSEVSVGAVVITEDGHKRTFTSARFIPRTAVCDPELTLSLPPSLTAATGMDAVTHCIEAVLSPTINPPAEAVGYDGLRRAIREGNLARATKDGQDKDARWHMMMASTEGALAFVRGLGAVHAMSHSCGRHHHLKLHHGTLNAVILPTILRYNADHVSDKYTRLREAMGLKSSVDLADFITGLNQRLGIPPNLSAMGIDRNLPGLIEHAIIDPAGRTNPRRPSEEDYEKLFDEAIG